MADHAAFVDAAVDACIAVDTLLAGREPSLFEAHGVGTGGDVSRGFDLAAERILVEALSPFGTVCSEESGRFGSGACTVVIDPLDGSDNYLSGFPYYGVSIALKRADAVVVGLVCDLSVRRCFLRTPDRHVTFPLYARSLASPVECNPEAKVGIFEKARLHPEAAVTLTDRGMKFRSPGAVALSFAYAHYVNYVLFLGTMRPYDMEAALYLCEDLFRYVDDRIAIVARDRDVFETLLNIFDLPKEHA